ncbi:MAG: hypothetical protein HC924_02200, partial [Synechococcaceae cyanobacterium SM2_3_2]|nr:hypothetical protein [Synechococcaceae cyanobacterium SM2_3_2]
AKEAVENRVLDRITAELKSGDVRAAWSEGEAGRLALEALDPDQPSVNLGNLNPASLNPASINPAL